MRAYKFILLVAAIVVKVESAKKGGGGGGGGGGGKPGEHFSTLTKTSTLSLEIGQSSTSEREQRTVSLSSTVDYHISTSIKFASSFTTQLRQQTDPLTTIISQTFGSGGKSNELSSSLTTTSTSSVEIGQSSTAQTTEGSTSQFVLESSTVGNHISPSITFAPSFTTQLSQQLEPKKFTVSQETISQTFGQTAANQITQQPTTTAATETRTSTLSILQTVGYTSASSLLSTDSIKDQYGQQTEPITPTTAQSSIRPTEYQTKPTLIATSLPSTQKTTNQLMQTIEQATFTTPLPSTQNTTEQQIQQTIRPANQTDHQATTHTESLAISPSEQSAHGQTAIPSGRPTQSIAYEGTSSQIMTFPTAASQNSEDKEWLNMPGKHWFLIGIFTGLLLLAIPIVLCKLCSLLAARSRKNGKISPPEDNKHEQAWPDKETEHKPNKNEDNGKEDDFKSVHAPTVTALAMPKYKNFKVSQITDQDRELVRQHAESFNMTSPEINAVSATSVNADVMPQYRKFESRKITKDDYSFLTQHTELLKGLTPEPQNNPDT